MIKVIIANMENRNSFAHVVCKEMIHTLNVVMYFQKNFYLIQKIDEVISSLLSSGIPEHLALKYIDMRYWHMKRVDKGPQKLTLKHFQGAFDIFIILASISITVFVFEIFSHMVRETAFNLIRPVTWGV